VDEVLVDCGEFGGQNFIQGFDDRAIAFHVSSSRLNGCRNSVTRAVGAASQTNAESAFSGSPV
jgi:hypothetical protein